MSKVAGKYDVNGQEVATIKEVSEILGRKVSKKEVVDGQVEGVMYYEDDAGTIPDEAVEALEQAVADGTITDEQAEELAQDATESGITVDDTTGEGDDTEEHEDDTQEEDTEDTDTDNEASTNKGSMDDLRAKLAAINARKKAEAAKATPKTATGANGEIEYPEKGSFKTEKELKKFYKKLTDDQLNEWLELEGLTDKVKLCDHEAINRMRKCMAIMEYHFPKAASEPKKKSKYADFTTEELVELAINNDIAVKDDKGDTRILRMYTIIALREAGLLE